MDTVYCHFMIICRATLCAIALQDQAEAEKAQLKLTQAPATVNSSKKQRPMETKPVLQNKPKIARTAYNVGNRCLNATKIIPFLWLLDSLNLPQALIEPHAWITP